MKSPKLLRKDKNTNDYVSDITKAYNKLSQRKKLYFITMSGIPTNHIKDLNFKLTNNFFNNIHSDIIDLNEQITEKFFHTINKDYKNSLEYLNYLFIIEYGGMISKEKESESFIRNMGLHCHCIVNTSLSKAQLEYYINTSFKRIPNYKIQDITKSNTKEDLLNYLLKQEKTGLLSKDNYNYKILNE